MKSAPWNETVSIYEPHELKALRKAFDIAWERITPNIRKQGLSIEVTRIALADTLFRLIRHGNLDESRLADNAVRVMFCRASGP
jgi:hypothetical protein